MMQPTTDTFQTSDNITIHTAYWATSDTPKAIVIIVHGIGEHIGRYQHVAEHLIAHDYAVYGLDHRTHGKSGGEPRAYFDNFEQPVADLSIYFDQIKAKHPHHKIFMLGHSMGSLITLLFTLNRQMELAGVISSGTPLNIDELASLMLTRIAKLLQRIAPKLPMIKLDAKKLSHDPEVVADYRNDPLVYQGSTRVHMATEILTQGQQVREAIFQLRVPLLVLHGEADEICPPSGSQTLFDRAGSPDKALKLYPDLYHEILNEPEKEQMLAEIVTWLNDHVSG